MNQQIIDYLNQLAAQLKVPVEVLWAVLIKQAYLGSCIDVCIYFLFGLAAYFGYKFINSEKIESIDRPPCYAIYFLACFCMFLIFIFAITNTITGFINPEYRALQNLLSGFKQ